MRQSSTPATLDALLVKQRNADGGWGYGAGNSSRLEPTAWALLATTNSGQRPDLGVLLRWPRQDGWLVDVQGAPINIAFNALVALALLTQPAGAAAARDLAAKITDARGITFPQGREIRQDNSLQAWPWIDTTFSWVEPTAWCLLLLKKMRGALPAASGERIAVGEKMLIDRACSAGGWNYGGSNVYGQELFPYVPTTALGLLAMQDRRDDIVVKRAVSWLEADALHESSALALGLAVVALAVHHGAVKPVAAALQQHLERPALRANTAGLAVALYALRSVTAGASAFTIEKL